MPTEAFFFDGKVSTTPTPAVVRPSSSNLLLCKSVNKGNHFLFWTFEPRKSLFPACVTSYWLFLATPLFDIIRLIFLHPFGVRVLLACVFRCFKPYRALSILLRWELSIYLASTILLCLSIVCPIELPGQLSLRRHLRSSTFPSTNLPKQQRKLPFLRFFHRSITTFFYRRVVPSFRLWYSSQPTSSHSLRTPNCHSLSTQVTNIDIDSSTLSPFIRSLSK